MSALKLARRSPDPPPPEHLSEASRATWRGVVATYAMADDVAGLHVLAATLEAEDLAERARRQVAEDGPYIEARGNDGGMVPHPMIRVQMRAASEARAGWKQLALAPPDQPEPLRPGRPMGRR
jgi:phage terminase small subunit